MSSNFSSVGDTGTKADVSSSDENSYVQKPINSKETPYPTSFSNLRNRTYMTQDDIAESFVFVKDRFVKLQDLQ